MRMITRSKTAQMRGANHETLVNTDIFPDRLAGLLRLPAGKRTQRSDSAHGEPVRSSEVAAIIRWQDRRGGRPNFSMKEGSSISSPDCPMLRVALVTTLEAGPESGIVSLRKEMSQYQFASRPVLAILSGVYVPDFPDDVRHRRYAVFKASAARDVRRSSHSERR